MNLFTCLLLCVASFAFNAECGEPGPAGMIMIAGPMTHRRVIHRKPFLLRHHNRRRHHKRRHHSHKHRKAKAFIEVVNVRERIVVDEHNRPKGAEAVLSNDLMTVNPNTGQVKMLMHRELHIKPKLPKPKQQQPAQTQKFIVNEYGPDGALRKSKPAPWLQAIIKRFRLDSFWPLFGFSVLMGFTFVGVVFLAAKCILTLIDGEDGDGDGVQYAPLLSDDALLASVDTAQPIQLTDEMTERSSSTSTSTAV